MDWLLYESDLRHKRGNGLSIVFNMLKVINKDTRTAPVTRIHSESVDDFRKNLHLRCLIVF